jgi:hypothetical protein
MALALAKRSPLLIFIGIAVLSYAPIALCIHTFRWDMLDVVLPFRYFAGECIRNGIFPAWNPYIFTGSPVCADLQYPLWSPEVWLIGLTSGYSIYILHVLFIGYLVLAGYGMYRLVFHFNGHRNAALLAGIAYMLNGFFTAHGQALFSIIGTAYLPWVVLYTIRFCQQPTFYRTCKLTLFIFLMISSGYQLISIITGYLLVAIVTYYAISSFRHSRPHLKKLISHSFLLALFTILVCLVIIVPVMQALPYNDRISTGVRYVKAIVYPFTWHSLISLAVPFSTVKYPEFFNTDISMRNIYTGLIILLIFFVSVFRKKSGLQWLILAFGFVCLLISFGPALPVHKFFYQYFPLMRNLRMPAYFTAFFVFAVIFIAGLHIPHILDKKSDQKLLQRLSLAGIVFMTPLLFYSLFHASPWPPFHEVFNNFFEYLGALTFHAHAVIQVIFQMLILALLYLALRNDRLASGLYLLVCFEMIVAVNLNSPFTVYDKFKPGAINTFMKSQPPGFPVPSQTPVSENSDRKLTHSPLWRNMGILTKKISYDGFSSFVLKSYNYMDDSLSTLRDSLIMNPPVTLSGNVFHAGDIRKPGRLFKKDDIYLDDNAFASLPVHLKKGASSVLPEIISFSPVECKVKYSLDTAAVITCMQAFYPGWTARVDGRKTQLFASNLMYISAVAPAGEHTILFRYENKLAFASFLVSCVVFTGLLVVLLFRAFSRT